MHVRGTNLKLDNTSTHGGKDTSQADRSIVRMVYMNPQVPSKCPKVLSRSGYRSASMQKVQVDPWRRKRICSVDGAASESSDGANLVGHDQAGQLKGKEEDAAQHASCEVDDCCADQPHKGCQQIALLRLRADELQGCIPKGLPPAEHLRTPSPGMLCSR